MGTNSLLNYVKFKDCKKIISCRDYASLEAHSLKFKKQLDKSDAMICNSYSLAEYYISLYPEDKNKIKIIYNIVDVNMINQLSKETVEKRFEDFIESHKVIISVGRFSKEKGFNHLVKAFEILKERIPKARLVIIGDGELYKEVSEMVSKSKHFSDILLLGYNINPFKYMKKCDVFALPSINEGFPNVVVEAMACALPVACTNCNSGPNEILNDKYNNDLVVEGIHYGDYGILTPTFKQDQNYNLNQVSESHHIFANALATIINNKDLKEKYKEASLKRVQDFAPESVSKDYKDVISSIMRINN